MSSSSKNFDTFYNTVTIDGRSYYSYSISIARTILNKLGKDRAKKIFEKI